MSIDDPWLAHPLDRNWWPVDPHFQAQIVRMLGASHLPIRSVDLAWTDNSVSAPQRLQQAQVPVSSTDVGVVVNRSLPFLVLLSCASIVLVPLSLLLGFEPRRPLPAGLAPGTLVLGASLGLAAFVVTSLFMRRADSYEKSLHLGDPGSTVMGIIATPELTIPLGKLMKRRIHLPTRAQLTVREGSWELKARGSYSQVDLPKEKLSGIAIRSQIHTRGAVNAVVVEAAGLSEPLIFPVAAVNGEVRAVRPEDLGL